MIHSSVITAVTLKKRWFIATLSVCQYASMPWLCCVIRPHSVIAFPGPGGNKRNFNTGQTYRMTCILNQGNLVFFHLSGPRCEGGGAAEHPELFVNNAWGTWESLPAPSKLTRCMFCMCHFATLSYKVAFHFQSWYSGSTLCFLQHLH